MGLVLQRCFGECLAILSDTRTFRTPIYLQALILVVDCTDRDRLALVRAELYKMLQHEVVLFMPIFMSTWNIPELITNVYLYYCGWLSIVICIRTVQFYFNNLIFRISEGHMYLCMQTSKIVLLHSRPLPCPHNSTSRLSSRIRGMCNPAAPWLEMAYPPECSGWRLKSLGKRELELWHFYLTPLLPCAPSITSLTFHLSQTSRIRVIGMRNSCDADIFIIFII